MRTPYGLHQGAVGVLGPAGGRGLGINWSAVKAVIFDVDGTLYCQAKLRRRMGVELARYYCLRPWRLRDLKILRDFRRERERRALHPVDDLENAQHLWAVQASGVPVERVRNVVEHWMLSAPLRHLGCCRYPGVSEFFARLRALGVRTGILSDYPAKDKLVALGLSGDCVVCATDQGVGRLKPAPDGLLFIAKGLGVSPGECLAIGDRDERDGECARSVGMPYVILERALSGRAHRFQTYYQLLSDLDNKTSGLRASTN